MKNLIKISLNWLVNVKHTRFYITDFVGDGLTIDTAFKPRPLDDQKLNSVQFYWVDGRPIGNTNGKCLIWATVSVAEHLRISKGSTYLPLEGLNGIPISINSKVSELPESNLDLIISELDTLLVPRTQIFILDDISSLLSRVQQRFTLSQILREDDLRIPLNQILSTAERNKIGQRIGSVIQKGQTAGEVIEHIIKDKKFDFHVQ